MQDAASHGVYELKLYIAGESRRSVAAIANLRKLCAQYLPGQHQIEIIDLLENPGLARADQIVAIPTLVRKSPLPMRKVIGDLSDVQRALTGLDLPVAI